MSYVDPTLIARLLRSGEGDTLDFKCQQYPFDEAEDDEKGEILKDILAFANAWRTEDAYILIGAEERVGERPVLRNVTPHLNDSHLQQFVNMKTNVRVEFEYVVVEFEGHSLGVIRIKAGQRRPVFLKKKFGKVTAEEVYVRRGSATAIAKPDEVAEMGAADAGQGRPGGITIGFSRKGSRSSCEPHATVVSIVIEDPVVQASESERINLLVRGITLNDIRDYRRTAAMIKPLRLCVKNGGSVVLKDARLVLEIPKRSFLTVTDEEPVEPKGFDLHMPRISLLGPTIRAEADHWEIRLDVGKIQPSAIALSDTLWISTTQHEDLPVKATLFADNLAPPVVTELQLKLRCVADGTVPEGYTD